TVVLRLGLLYGLGSGAPSQDVLCSPSTPERQSLFESHRQRRWLTCWSYTLNLTTSIDCHQQRPVEGKSIYTRRRPASCPRSPPHLSPPAPWRSGALSIECGVSPR